MLIGELATASGLSREALRFYEQQGLIRARRLDNGYRDYPPEVVTLVQYIRTCLLYTSPSPRDQRGYRMPSSA